MSNKKEYLYVIIYDIVNIICWLTLAILFNKWWIMFFASITMLTLKNGTSHSRTCDNCGKRGPSAESSEETINKAKKIGWHHNPDGTDYCPECTSSFTKINK